MYSKPFHTAKWAMTWMALRVIMKRSQPPTDGIRNKSNGFACGISICL